MNRNELRLQSQLQQRESQLSRADTAATIEASRVDAIAAIAQRDPYRGTTQLVTPDGGTMQADLLTSSSVAEGTIPSVTSSQSGTFADARP